MRPRIPAATPMPRKAGVVMGLAIVGAVTLTAGVLTWVIGSVMDVGFHGTWSGVASAGGQTALAGLLFGLIMIVLAASGRREGFRARPRRAGRAEPAAAAPDQALMPVAPEQQAFLADPPPPAPPMDQPPLMEQPPPMEQAPPPYQPGEQYVPAGPYPPGEPYPPGAPMPPPGAGAYPPPGQPWPAPGTFGSGGPPDGQPYYADPALPPYPAMPDDTYPRFPAVTGPPFSASPEPYGASPEPFGGGPQPAPGQPPPERGTHQPPGDDYPDFHRERGFPVPPESRGEGGYRRLAAPEEWW